MTANRIRDFALYIVIGLLLGGVCIWFAAYDIDVKWFSLALETCLVFGCVIGMSRRLWRLSAFWLCLVGLIGVHLASFATVLRQVQQWRASTVGVIFAIETSTALALTSAVTSRVKMRRRRGRHKPSRS